MYSVAIKSVHQIITPPEQHAFHLAKTCFNLTLVIFLGDGSDFLKDFVNT